MENNYDFLVQEKLSTIYHWAEMQITSPQSYEYNKTYLDCDLRDADKKIAWMPIYESYRGNSAKRRGTATIKIVSTFNGQSYGFYMHAQLAEKIYNLLRNYQQEKAGINNG